MNVDVLTLKKPGRCARSINSHDMFIFDALTLRDNPEALARLKVAMRERDKWFIIQHQQGNNYGTEDSRTKE